MSLDLAKLREGWDFEAKLAAGRDGRGAVPASFFETYSAMANTDGGVIALGLAERKDGSFDVAGLADAARVEQELWDQLDNRQKVSVNVLSRRDVTLEREGDRDLLVVRVPRAHRTAKPVYLGGNPLNAFRRSGQGDRRCTEPEVRRMIADASDVPADSAIVEGYGLDALDSGTLEVWRNLFSAMDARHPFLQGDVVGMLRSIGAWRTDAASGADGPTVAGLLMFGGERAILDRFPWYQLDYREIDERRPELRWADRVTLDGKWPGNVFSFFLRVEPRLVADLKVPFKLATNMQRIDATPAHEALREALVNALIHADYTGTRGIRVFKRRQSFEFVNPGLLRVPWTVAVHGNASDPRNPSLQKMFQLVGFGDRAGSGVPRITLAWRDEGWPSPKVSEDFEAQETRLLLCTGSPEPRADADDPVADPVTGRSDPVADPVTGRSDPVARLEDPVDRVLAALREGPLAPSELRAALGLKHRPTFRSNYLRPALEAGLIAATLPDRPNSRLQQYRLTEQGAARLVARSQGLDS